MSIQAMPLQVRHAWLAAGEKVLSNSGRQTAQLRHSVILSKMVVLMLIGQGAQSESDPYSWLLITASVGLTALQGPGSQYHPMVLDWCLGLRRLFKTGSCVRGIKTTAKSIRQGNYFTMTGLSIM